MEKAVTTVKAPSERAAEESLRAHFQGELIGPKDAGYDEARAIWNGAIDRRPQLIARCSSAADVAAAVRYARERELLVAVRSGGHNVAGTAMCDGGLVIDLSPMKGMRVDPAARRAWAEPGLLWGEFDRQTQAFGLATTGGIITHTGVAGLTLGGGIGWLMRKYGLTCDNLLSAEVVTAEGEVLRASERENADLFWGIRGGGGNFGVVTNFEFQLHPVGPEVFAGMLIYPAAQAKEVMGFYREFIADAPDELGTGLNLKRAPAVPWLPESAHGEPVVYVMVCYAGPLAEGEKLLAPLRAFGRPLANRVGPMSYVTAQGLFDAAVPHGLHYYWKSSYTGTLSDEAIGTLITYGWETTSPLSYTIIFQMGGAVARVPAEATPFSGRKALHAVNINAAWRPEHVEGGADATWAREMWAALEPFTSGGVYMNFLGNEGAERIKAAYGAGNYERLVALKDKYDPTNFFRMNQNIQPSGNGR